MDTTKILRGDDLMLFDSDMKSLAFATSHTLSVSGSTAEISCKDAGVWTGTFGVNYNIDATKYVGLYVTDAMAHATGDWELADGVGYGVKFGIDF